MRERAPRSELQLRLASTVVLAPVAVVTAYLGGWSFLAFWCAAAIGIVWEWSALAGSAPWRAVAAGAAVQIAGTVLFGFGQVGAAIAALAVGAILAAGLAPSGWKYWTMAGTACAGAVLSAPAFLRSDAQWGFSGVILLFATVWTTDVAAYFVGRLVGGPRLWPAVSPNKTWSGAFGGMAAAIGAGAVFAAVEGIGSVPELAILCGGLSLTSQAGDLAESALKRRLGAKDASHLIPGHGGVMDRLDGFATAAVAGAIIGLCRGGPHAPGRGLVMW